MVQRDSCNNETDVPLNGVPNGSRERGRSAVVIATDTVLARGGYNSGTRSLTRTGNDRFSLFRWFKRNRDSTVEKRRRMNTRLAGDDVVRRRSVCSSVESIDSFYSTTTVRSFAFHTGTLGHCNVLSFDILKQAADVGPFAAGASKLTITNKDNDKSGLSCTLPTNVHSKRRNITTRYSLHPSTIFGSCKNFPTSDKELTSPLRRFSDRTENSSCNSTVRKQAHVKGKRRAPNPPNTVIKIVGVDVREISKNSNRRKRRAPRPPEKITDNRPTEEQSKDIDGGMDVEERKDIKERQSISNDTLILQGGILLSKKEIFNSSKVQKDDNSGLGISTLTVSQERAQSPVGSLNTVMPRPWYKRNTLEHLRDSGSSKKNAVFHSPTNSINIKEECIGTSSTSYPADASLSKLNFFHRGERQDEDKKREIKRKSGLSILTNISELDKEAAAIVQEEQARTRESMLLRSPRFPDVFDKNNDTNEEIVQEMVTSAMENSSPRRGTRALISKFNAISNITKVTINTNFFARKDQSGYKSDRDTVRKNRFQQIRDCKDQTKCSIPQDIGQNIRVSKDISKYFLPHQKTSKTKIDVAHTDTRITSSQNQNQNDQLMKDTSTRISFLQSQLAANRITESLNAQKKFMLQEIDENIELPQEIIGKEKENNSPRLDKEINRRLLLSRVYNKAENIENTLSSSAEKVKKKTDHTEGIQKEFSDIFDEIDRQLCSRQFKFIEQRPFVESENIRDKVPQNETAAPSKLTQALDILMETVKDDKMAPVIQLDRSIRNKERLIDSGQRTKSSKTKLTNLNTVEDSITTDLKEMIKEMKHSLPKRLKAKKSTLNDIDVLEKAEKRSPLSSNKTYVASVSTKTETLLNDYETDKQKVSSAAQTSGNIRRLNQPSTFYERPSTSSWKQEGVLYETSGKGSGLVKNTFQLIRPRDFAEIEAMKTTKKVYEENVYANVIETSLYANTHVTPTSSKQQQNLMQSKNISQNKHAKVSSNTANEYGISSVEKKFTEEANDNPMAKDMNTLAINRLLRKLEGAIASGHHQQAAGLAKELARLKIHCSVIRQRSTAHLKDQSIEVNMYIEDKLAHQGPIPLQLPTRMTMAELKTKIHTEFEIPTNVQRWIIGKSLADRDEVTLNELQAVDGVPIFLYLVAPELQIDEATQTNKSQPTKDEGSKELHQGSPVNTLQTIEKDQVTEEKQERSSTINAPQERIVETDVLVKMERYEELILLENCDIIPNSESIECPICFITYGPHEGVILRDCLHMFCRSCIANTVAYCDEAEVKCPYRDAEYTCESTLQEREIKALVDPGIYQQHLAKSIAQAEKNAGNKAFHCKTPDCPGWCIYDDGVNSFLCPVCGVNNCLTCQVVHIGKNCKQYQQDLLFSKETDQESKRTADVLKEMVDKGEALVCPTCAVVLIKKWGCDWLLCSMCKTEICWVTRGPRWGPGGKGDTSGGCRCGENGIKCHPQCNYCH